MPGPDFGSVPWWFGGSNVLVVAAVWAFATVSAAYLRYDATIWAEAWALARRRATPREFLAAGWWCDRCSTYWLTAPLVIPFGPVVWLAVNGAYLLLSTHLPTLAPLPDGEPEGVA